jgi:hypothetical protein
MPRSQSCHSGRRSRSRSCSRARSASRRRSQSRRSRTPTPPPAGPRPRVERSRSRSERLERSVSRELYKEEPKKIKELQQYVDSQQDILVELLNDHKAKVDEKLSSKARRFSSKQLEKQYQVNQTFKDLVEKIREAHKAKEWKVAKRTADELAEGIEEHEQDLIIADISPHGWLAVNKLRNTSDLPKALRKRLTQVEKDLEAQKTKHGSRKKPLSVQGTGTGSAGSGANRKFSPEEALSFASKQIRPGTCSHCHKEYHFYRECPVFWTKVQEGREAKAKGAGGTN